MIKFVSERVEREWNDSRLTKRPQSQINAVANYINNRYVYNPDKPSLKVCFKEAHGTGPHAHFQVHANTRRR